MRPRHNQHGFTLNIYAASWTWVSQYLCLSKGRDRKGTRVSIQNLQTMSIIDMTTNHPSSSRMKRVPLTLSHYWKGIMTKNNSNITTLKITHRGLYGEWSLYAVTLFCLWYFCRVSSHMHINGPVGQMRYIDKSLHTVSMVVGEYSHPSAPCFAPFTFVQLNWRPASTCLGRYRDNLRQETSTWRFISRLQRWGPVNRTTGTMSHHRRPLAGLWGPANLHVDPRASHRNGERPRDGSQITGRNLRTWFRGIHGKFRHLPCTALLQRNTHRGLQGLLLWRREIPYGRIWARVNSQRDHSEMFWIHLRHCNDILVQFLMVMRIRLWPLICGLRHRKDHFRIFLLIRSVLILTRWFNGETKIRWILRMLEEFGDLRGPWR